MQSSGVCETHKRRCRRRFTHVERKELHPLHSCHSTFLSSTENAAEKELRREDADYKDPGEFIFYSTYTIPS